MANKVDYEILREGQEEVMKIDATSWNYVPSVEDSAACMLDAINRLAEFPSVARLIYNQRKNYEYDYNQTQMLVEVANVYSHLMRQKNITSLEYLGGDTQRFAMLRFLLHNLLRTDPLGAYVQTKRILREERINMKRVSDLGQAGAIQNYISFLEYFISLMEKTKLISLLIDKLDGYVLGDRSLYKEVFRVNITPDFMFTKLMSRLPLDGKQIDGYALKSSDVSVFEVPKDIKYLYHITPPEFKISEDEQLLINLARSVLIEHKPQEQEFLEPSKLRRTFFNIGRDLLQELVEQRNLNIPLDKIERMARILVRYTVGFGILEILLEDEKIQDIVVNSPIGETPIFIVHGDYGECVTNIIPSAEDGEGWATKFRLLSGRPLDEANPVLDTELVIPAARARVAIMTRPLSPNGLAYALRRHRGKPWTFPLYVNNKMMNHVAAGLLSFFIDGARTMLVAGTRSSGKTSLLGGLLVEIMRKYRVITVEDTLELPVRQLRKLGYNIQPMKVRAALMTGGTEISADEGIRTSLRLGDSSLIVGEVRSLEAKALYEAMRVGALANVVAGTIHGDSPYGVFDRVVNDLEVPRTSFKATDIIVVCNPVKSPDGLHSWKRVVQITEVRKHWEEDPLAEKGFVDLMRYDPKKDELVLTDDLINGDSEVVKGVAGNVREWAGNWGAIWENIMLRAKIKKTLVDYAVKSNKLDLLEAEFVILSNDKFHKFSDEVREEVGIGDSKMIFEKWDSWLKENIKTWKIK